jgi:hypothetical protein
MAEYILAISEEARLDIFTIRPSQWDFALTKFISTIRSSILDLFNKKSRRDDLMVVIRSKCSKVNPVGMSVCLTLNLHKYTAEL